MHLESSDPWYTLYHVTQPQLRVTQLIGFAPKSGFPGDFPINFGSYESKPWSSLQQSWNMNVHTDGRSHNTYQQHDHVQTKDFVEKKQHIRINTNQLKYFSHLKAIWLQYHSPNPNHPSFRCDVAIIHPDNLH